MRCARAQLLLFKPAYNATTSPVEIADIQNSVIKAGGMIMFAKYEGRKFTGLFFLKAARFGNRRMRPGLVFAVTLFLTLGAGGKLVCAADGNSSPTPHSTETPHATMT